jgi:hypothetical protein
MRFILLHPAGLAALAALVAPILVHLLLRRRARRVPFPSLRFVRPANAAAVRLRAITDWPLLMVRCAIVAAAALALARPLLVTPARRAAWDARTARAIVVDVTPTAGDPSAAVAEERHGAFNSTIIRSTAIDAGIAEAVAWLDTAPPARREVVVISDFQLGTVDRLTVDCVPESVGVRFRQTTPAAPSLAEPAVQINVHAPVPERAVADAALRAAGQESTAPDRGAHRRAVAIYTRGVRPPEELGRLRAPWMAAVAAGLPNARTGAIDERSMLVVLDTPASSFELPRAIRSIRRALLAPTAWRELEPERLPSATLAAWSRPAPPIGGVDGENADRDDRRWFWLAALAFIGLETWLRRRVDARTSEVSIGETVRAA